MKMALELRLELMSDTIFSSGHSIPGGEDIAVRTDEAGYPFLPGSTVKGLLRESMTDLLCWTDGDPQTIEALFGAEGFCTQSGRRLGFTEMKSVQPPAEAEECFTLRTFTQMENGLVKDGSLRVARCLRKGLRFEGKLFCESEDAALVKDALKGIRSAGLMRNRGFGAVHFTAENGETIASAVGIEECGLLRYRLRLETPLTVSGMNGAVEGDSKNYTETRRYIPGATVRGFVISTLAQRDPAWFEQNKALLLSEQVRFSDALPTTQGDAVIPTPKGFYEDKAKTRFYSVLTQEVQPGDKRAGTGEFCTIDIEKKHLQCHSSALGSSMRIKRGAEKQVFTVRHLAAGQEMVGYIRLDCPALAPKISDVFEKWIALGADRYAGSGICSVTEMKAVPQPAWFEYGWQENEDVSEELVMMLVSPMSMLRNGEPVGLDEETLAAALGVEKVELIACATSVMETAGFNSTWRCRPASTVLYDSGSVFHLHCTPAPAAAKLRQLQENGIGMRREEGCGQVLFLKGYDEICGYEQSELKTSSAEKKGKVAETRRARCKWLLEKAGQTRKEMFVSASQMGSIQALCEEALMQGGTEKALAPLWEHLRHNQEERGARHAEGYKKLGEQIRKVLETPVWETIKTEAQPDEMQDRIRLLCDWFDLSRKGGVCE